MNTQPFCRLTRFLAQLAQLAQLKQHNIHYSLASHRNDAIMVLVTVPGGRWEVSEMALSRSSDLSVRVRYVEKKRYANCSQETLIKGLPKSCKSCCQLQ